MENKKNNNWFTFLLIVVGLVFFLNILNRQSSSNIVTVYPITCSIENKQDNFATVGNCKNPVADDPVQYKVSADKQEVLSLHNISGVDKLSNCLVFDTQSWYCKESGYGSSLTMIKGKLIELNTDQNGGPKYQPIGRYYTDKDSWLWVRSGHNPMYYLLNLL